MMSNFKRSRWACSVGLLSCLLGGCGRQATDPASEVRISADFGSQSLSELEADGPDAVDRDAAAKGAKCRQSPRAALAALGVEPELLSAVDEVTTAVAASGGDARTHWLGWRDRLFQTRKDDVALPDGITRIALEVGIANYGLAGQDDELYPDCAPPPAPIAVGPAAGPTKAAPPAMRMITVGHLAALLYEACWMDATFNHLVRYLPDDVSNTARVRELKDDPEWLQDGWFASVLPQIPREQWTVQDQLANTLWALDAKGARVRDATLRAQCKLHTADREAPRRIARWLSAPATSGQRHPDNQQAARLFEHPAEASAVDWQRAREWMRLLRARGLGSKGAAAIVVNVASQKATLLQEGVAPIWHRVIAGSPNTVTPLQFGVANPDTSFQVMPRRTVDPSGSVRNYFDCGRRKVVLYSPTAPLGKYKLQPQQTNLPNALFGDRKGPDPVVGVHPRVYLHGHAAAGLAIFERNDDGKRARSNGCIRAQDALWQQVNQAFAGDKYAASAAISLAEAGKTRGCWWNSVQNCTSAKLRRDVCFADRPIEGEYRTTVKLNKDRSILMAFVYLPSDVTGTAKSQHGPYAARVKPAMPWPEKPKPGPLPAASTATDGFELDFAADDEQATEAEREPPPDRGSASAPPPTTAPPAPGGTGKDKASKAKGPPPKAKESATSHKKTASGKGKLTGKGKVKGKDSSKAKGKTKGKASPAKKVKAKKK